MSRWLVVAAALACLPARAGFDEDGSTDGVVIGNGVVVKLEKQVIPAVQFGTAPPKVDCPLGSKHTEDDPVFKAYAKANYDKHVCKPDDYKTDPLKDMFARSCTCPNPDARLGDLDKATNDAGAQVSKEVGAASAAIESRTEVKAGYDKFMDDACDKCKSEFGKTIKELSGCLGDRTTDWNLRMDGKSDGVYGGLKAAGWKPAPVPPADRRDSLGLISMAKPSPPLNPAIDAAQCGKMIRGKAITPIKWYAKDYLVKAYHDGVLKTSPTQVFPGSPSVYEVVVAPDTFKAVDEEMKKARDRLYPKEKFAKAKAIFDAVKARARAWLEPQLVKMEDAACPWNRYLDINGKHDELGRSVCTDRFKQKRDDFDKLKFEPSGDFQMVEQMNAEFDSKTNSVSFGVPYLEMAAKSPETFERTLAHEVGHKIFDTLKLKDKQANPLAACLRSADSVGARKEPKDQLNESFADWFGTEMMVAKYGDGNTPANQKNYLDMERSLCHGGYIEDDDKAKEDSHPTAPARINRILAANPAVRKAFGAADSANPKYCTPPATFYEKD